MTVGCFTPYATPRDRHAILFSLGRPDDVDRFSECAGGPAHEETGGREVVSPQVGTRGRFRVPRFLTLAAVVAALRCRAC
jgi:hypothetical protein